jgi:hypothetical protein
MNAPIKTDPQTDEIEREVEALLSRLEMSHMRKRIADYWLAGWCTGDLAMQLLVHFDLIEFDERLLAERDTA